MTTASQRTVQVLEQIVKSVPIGTNLALLQLMWAMISGAFLTSRGAIHAALVGSRFNPPETRRSWRALRAGQWHIHELLSRFRAIVETDGQWKASDCDGLKPVAVDLSAIWRPRLQGWPGKMFRRLTERKMTGIGFGLIADVGFIEDQRVPLLRAIVRGETASEGETTLQKRTLHKVAQLLEENDVAIHDAGASLRDIQEAGVPRYVVRQRSNLVARRNRLPTRGRGRPYKFGQIIRPLPRRWKDKQIDGSPADSWETFIYQERLVGAKGWHNLVRADQPVSKANPTFSVWVIEDPAYEDPWVLVTNVACTAEQAYRLYLSRWPVEQIPQVSKQLLGLQRQFVFAHQSCWRLGELAFLVGNILAWLAAVSPPMASGFWDRHPKKHQVAFDAGLARVFFQMNGFQTPNFEKSNRSQPIYPKVLPPIDAQERLIKGKKPILTHIVKVQGSDRCSELLQAALFATI
jgi:hypothetical protein